MTGQTGSLQESKALSGWPAICASEVDGCGQSWLLSPHCKAGRFPMAQEQGHDHENGPIEKLDIRIEYCVP